MLSLTQEQREQLLKNGTYENRDNDHVPVVKLFLPDTGCTWLLTELNPDYPDRAFGLCDLDIGFPELDYVLLSELSRLSIGPGYTVEVDRHFYTEYPISIFVAAAVANQAITDDPFALKEAWMQSAHSRRGKNTFTPQ